MGMTRTERRNLHKKQEKLGVGSGAPNAEELSDGVPVLRLTEEGLVEYVAINGILYKNVFTKQ